MQGNYQNIYKNARQSAGYTQERWAEVLGISIESVRLYETGRSLPSDEVATMMSEIALMPVLCYRHLLAKSRVANDILPEVDQVDLPRAVLQLICRMRRFGEKNLTDKLMEIAEDGRVDEFERAQFDQIVEELGEIIQAAMTVKFAKGGQDDRL